MTRDSHQCDRQASPPQPNKEEASKTNGARIRDFRGNRIVGMKKAYAYILISRQLPPLHR